MQKYKAEILGECSGCIWNLEGADIYQNRMSNSNAYQIYLYIMQVLEICVVYITL